MACEFIYELEVSSSLEDLLINPVLMENIKQAIGKQSIVILHGLLSPTVVRSAIEYLHDWGKTIAPSPSQPIPETNHNYHVIERGVSRHQKTLHLFHAYNLNNFQALPSHLRESLEVIFGPMLRFYNAYTSRNLAFRVPEEGMSLHPQAIHYPPGGGFFAAHIHKRHPQEIGLILHGSQKGEDYMSGATGFDVNGSIVDTDDRCHPGDLVVFNYGQLHWVTPCEIEKELNLATRRGRWVFTLPWY